MNKLRRRNNRSGTKEQRDWSQLPGDMLTVICRKLYYIDQVNVRVVCKSWRCFDWVRPLTQMPWLLLFDDEDEYSCKLIDPQYKKTYSISMNIVRQKNLSALKVHESKEGWLLISSRPHQNSLSTTLFLFTPFSTKNNFIELPVLSTPFSIATFSTNPSKEDFVLLTMVCSSSNYLSITTFRLGDDSWNTNNYECHFPISNTKSLLYFDGNFHVSSDLGSMGAYDIATHDWVVRPNPVIVDNGYESDGFEVYTYLMKFAGDSVEDEDEIFLLFVSNVPCTWGRLLVTGFRLNSSEMVWERTEYVRDRVMFLGSGCTSFMTTAKYREHGNRIYYIRNRTLKHCTVHLADRSYPCTRLYGPLAKCFRKKAWVEPPQFRLVS